MSKVTLEVEENQGASYLIPNDVLSVSNVQPLYRAVVNVTFCPKGKGTAISGKGLIDTGADITSIDGFIAEANGWVPIRRGIPMKTAGQVHKSDLYEATLRINSHSDIRLNVLTANLHLQRLVALVGTDVLAKGRLIYDGLGSKFTLELP